MAFGTDDDDSDNDGGGDGSAVCGMLQTLQITATSRRPHRLRRIGASGISSGPLIVGLSPTSIVISCVIVVRG